MDKKPLKSLGNLVKELIDNSSIENHNDDIYVDDYYDETNIETQPLTKYSDEEEQSNAAGNNSFDIKKWREQFDNDMKNCVPSADDSYLDDSSDCNDDDDVTTINNNDDLINDNNNINNNKNDLSIYENSLDFDFDETILINDQFTKHLQKQNNKPPIQSTPKIPQRSLSSLSIHRKCLLLSNQQQQQKFSKKSSLKISKSSLLKNDYQLLTFEQINKLLNHHVL